MFLLKIIAEYQKSCLLFGVVKGINLLGWEKKLDLLCLHHWCVATGSAKHDILQGALPWHASDSFPLEQFQVSVLLPLPKMAPKMRLPVKLSALHPLWVLLCLPLKLYLTLNLLFVQLSLNLLN